MNSGNAKIRGASLRNKVMIPFFAILIALGSAATIGTILIISNTLENTADERLLAYQKQVYGEIRDLEERLLRRANLLELAYILDRTLPAETFPELAKVESLIDDSLVADGITARYISPLAIEKYPDPNLSTLLNLAKKSGKEQIRFTSDIGPRPSLTVVKPILSGNEITQYVVLQAALGDDYLFKISTPLNLKTALYDLNGSYLVGSHPGHDYLKPGPETLGQVLGGQNVFLSQDKLLKRRNIFYAIPLGTTDMLVVQLEMPLANVSSIVGTLASRSAISILVAMLIGGYIYYRLISQTLSPAQSMMQATRAIGEGNLDYRIEDIPSGEFGQLADAFNNMMHNISGLYAQTIERERELTKAQEQLRYKDILEEKNRSIESANNELKEHLKEISTLLQLNQAMASTLELDTLFARVIHALSDLLGCDMVSLMIYNPENKALDISHTLGIDHELLADISFSLNEGISGEAARTHQPIYVPDLKLDKRYMNYKGKLSAEGSLLCMPLLSKDRLCGVLNLHHQEVGGFDEDDKKMARAVANQLAVAIENAQLYEQAKKQSITDELTGLANRRHFQDILQREIIQARRYSANTSMIMADIDHFKDYNDTHGHLQGDIALKKVANILLQNTRGIDLTARFGGEEFVILLPKTTVAGARSTAEKLREIIEQEEFIGETASQAGGRLTISLGVAAYPDHTSDMEQLLDLADRALYQAKENGRNQVCIWDESVAMAGQA